MSDLGWNVWGAVTGAIGVIAFVPLGFCWLNSQLPNAQLGKLDQLLAATDALFDTAVKDGVLHPGNGLHRFHVKLWAKDLNDLMSFVVFYPESHLDRIKEQRATRKKLLARFGSKLSMSASTTSAYLEAQSCSSKRHVQDVHVAAAGYRMPAEHPDSVGVRMPVRRPLDTTVPENLDGTSPFPCSVDADDNEDRV
ncbi:hypothetical protein C8Q73DRAFT_794100 [Cubamyces lactineus]|nr:hypothetical protein C8Q73DRAFT_794100 [Cubamyces lactineus]